MTTFHRLLRRARSENGVTMVIAMGVMLVTSLLLGATFVAARNDISLSHTDTTQKEAYYAALAGVQEFEYQMQINPNYWQTCGEQANKLPQETGSSYKVKILPATGQTACSTSKPFESVIESTGSAANTFRIESVGSAGKSPEEHHTIVATFKVTGFLNFIYYTNHEDEDPSLYSAPTGCSLPNTYYPETETDGCQRIEFATGDSINGPVHTNDAACVGGSASFGRSGHTPPDVVEFYRGLNSKCTGTGKYYTATKNYIKGELLTPPSSDASLATYATEEDKFSGVTVLTLDGATNEIEVTNAEFNGGLPKKIPWPSNGLIWVKQASGSCNYTYSPIGADGPKEAESETNCGNVYVSGTYSKSLTIGSSDDVIVKGPTYPEGNLGGEPTGTATLGLIANNFVRVYHPIKETYEGSTPELETVHSDLETEKHQEVIKVEGQGTYAKELEIEVKSHGSSEFEILVRRTGKSLETIGPFKEAEKLLKVTSSNVAFEEGAHYAEGKAEKIKSTGSYSPLSRQEVIKISPKSGHLGKELQIKVKEYTEAGVEYDEVILLNSSSVALETIKKIKEAKELTTHTSSYVKYEAGGKYSQGEKEKLKETEAKWLDEKCNENGNNEIEQFRTSARECEYTMSPQECDAPTLNKAQDTVHEWGSLENLWLYAAILSTTHSFVVDNFNCEKSLGYLHLYGALAQNYRGIVGTGNGNTGYLKDYKYDQRLAVDEPPYFLSPLNAGWKVARETSPTGG
jgi:hypothetical protein